MEVFRQGIANSLALQWFKFLPTPTSAGATNNYLVPQPVPNTILAGANHYLIRIDHNVSDNYRLTFRYIHDSWQTVVPNALWGNNATGNLAGRALRRSEVVGRPVAQEAFAVVHAVLAQETRLAELLGR